jgi:hypothetical protein
VIQPPPTQRPKPIISQKSPQKGPKKKLDPEEEARKLQEERLEDVHKRQELTRIKAIQNAEKEKKKYEKNKLQKKQTRTEENMKMMISPEERKKAQMLNQKLREELQWLSWVSPEPEDPADVEFFPEAFDLKASPIYPNLSPLCQREWDLKEYALATSVTDLFKQKKHLIPNQQFYSKPSEDTLTRYNSIYCFRNLKLSWQFLLLKVLSLHPAFFPEEVSLKESLMQQITDQAYCDVMQETVDSFQERRNEILTEALDYPQNPSKEVSKNLRDLFEFIQQKVILLIDDNYAIAQGLYEESIKSKEEKEKQLEEECLARLYEAFQRFRSERVKSKVAKTARSEPVKEPKKTPEKTPKKTQKKNPEQSNSSSPDDDFLK